MPALLDPINIGSLEIRNRIVMPAMATNLATEKGEITDALIEHYVERAKGIGMLITEHAYVTFTGRLTRNQLGIHDDELKQGLFKLTNKVHNEGVPIIAQINHVGGRATSDVTGSQPLAPSAVCTPGNTEVPKELTDSELEYLVEAFCQGARRAVESGYDGVEIHGAHAFLLNQFLSPLTNKRSDEYGGCLENRMRFPLKIVGAVRNELGKNIPLLYRLVGEDRVPGGLPLSEGVEAAKLLADNGINALNVSGGFYGSKPKNMKDQGFYFYLAEEIRKNVKIPVIGVGGVKDPKFASDAIKNGKVDMVAVGRAILSDPSWAIEAAKILSQAV